jgi:hypothetical protein
VLEIMESLQKIILVSEAVRELQMALHEDGLWTDLSKIRNLPSMEREKALAEVVSEKSASGTPRERAQLAMYLAVVNSSLTGLGLLLEGIRETTMPPQV